MYNKLKLSNGMLYYKKGREHCDIVIIGKIPTIGYWSFTVYDDVTEQQLLHIQDDGKYATYGISGNDWDEVFDIVGGTQEDWEYIMSIPDME